MDTKSDIQTETPKLTLTDYLSKLKAYNHLQYFTEGALIDAMDNNNSWRVARISQIKNDVASLSFDGWSSKWDEVKFLFSFFINGILNFLESKNYILKIGTF